MITVVVSAALVGVLAMSGGLSAAFREQWLFFLPVLALGAWDGWLLFSPDRVRWVAWAVLPVANESIYQEFIEGPSAVSATGEPVRVSELLGIATAYILLRSVRRRAWLWPVIRVGTLFLIQFAYGTLESISGGDQAENFASWLNKFFQIPSGLAAERKSPHDIGGMGNVGSHRRTGCLGARLVDVSGRARLLLVRRVEDWRGVALPD
jgi:hypothetical protein